MTPLHSISPTVHNTEQDYERCSNCGMPICPCTNGGWTHEDSDQMGCEDAEPREAQ